MTQTWTRILTVTLNPALDVAAETPELRPDEKLRCSLPRNEPGGGGVNVARAVTYLGGRAEAMVALGGPVGAVMRAMIEAEGITVHDLGVGHPTRQTLNVTEGRTGRQYRFMLPGPEWTGADCVAAAAAILGQVRAGDLVVASGSLPPGVPPDFFPALAGDLAARGAGLVVDTSGPALARAARGGASPLVALRMNRVEAEALAARPLASVADAADLASALVLRGAARIVAIAYGAEGTIVAEAGGRWLCHAPDVEVVSRVGAGDSFVAGFVLALSRGATTPDACALGVAAATSAVTTSGTRLCERGATEGYLAAVAITAI
ncbi:hexose kinase [Halovulum dunhuangense]|uniref:Phosphofructokinase n=1 Tax=Halovulum dunhuangense TaxID=1505036 RepID=A0A849L4W4_9RHOB|nr:hexose kinase [Halovulum dunhuangense]NNU81177.1 hexose kinase [Halovulum dunhuangense]